MVIAWINLVLTSTGGLTGVATITGLPFPVSASTPTAGGFVNYADNMAGLISVPTVLTPGGGTTAELYQWGASGVAALTDSSFTNTTSISLTVVYFT